MSSILDQIRARQLPESARQAVVQGFMPLEPGELITAISILVGDDPSLLPDAQATFEQMPIGVQIEYFQNRELDPKILDFFLSTMALQPEVKSEALLNPRASGRILVAIAPTLEADLLDLVVNNQVKIQETPEIIDALRENPQIGINHLQKLDDYKRLLFRELVSPAEELEETPIEEVVEKAVEEAREYVAVFGKEKVTARDIAKDSQPEEADKKASALQQVTAMTVPQKIQAAIKGGREIRSILVRDANRLVCSAVIKSPRITEAEIDFYSNLRNVQTDVLRLIAMNREWVRNYKIMLNLVRNPRTPLALTMRLLPSIMKKDLRALTHDRGIPEALRKSAKRFLQTGRSR